MTIETEAERATRLLAEASYGIRRKPNLSTEMNAALDEWETARDEFLKSLEPKTP